jgi:hypothetical protein
MTRLTLSDLEIERGDTLEMEMVDGTVYELQDPKALPVELMVTIEDLAPLDQVKAIIAKGQWDAFVKHPEVDGYYFAAVMDHYAKHFGIDSLGNVGGSSPSLRDTAKPSKRTSPKKGTR